MKEKNKELQSKWKPKKFCKTVTLDSKTGKIIKREFITARTPEEEEKWEEELAERWGETMETLWGDKLGWFMRSLEYLVDKYGEKEFIRRWNKAMRESGKREKNKST